MLRRVPRALIGVTVEHEAVSVVTQSVERGRGEQSIGRERLIPFGQIEVARDDGGRSLVTLGDQFVQILVGGRTQRLEPEVIDDQQFDAHQAGEPALVGAGGASGIQARGELGASGEQHVDALTYGAMTKGLRQVISYRLSTHVRGFGAGLYAGSGIGWLRRDWRTSSGTLNCAATIRLPSWTEIELPS